MYISNKDLHAEIVISKAQGKLTRRAKTMLHLLAIRTHRKFFYYNEDDKHDTLQEGLYVLFKNWFKYDEERFDNAFAYYTELFKRGCAQSFNQIYEKKKDREKPIKISLYSYDEGGNPRARI